MGFLIPCSARVNNTAQSIDRGQAISYICLLLLWLHKDKKGDPLKETLLKHYAERSL